MSRSFATYLTAIVCSVPLFLYAHSEIGNLAQAQAPPLDGNSEAVDTKTGATSQDSKEEAEYYELLKLFVDTLDQVERNYAEEISRRELMEAAIRGMLSRLDAHSNYIPPSQLDDFQRGITSQFGGIGIRIGIDTVEDFTGSRPVVISPLPGTPAYRAGLMAGDLIMEINGESTKDFNIDDVVSRLKGLPNTEVTMEIYHRYNRERETVTLEREIISIETVLGDRRHEDDTWDYMYDDELGIGYIRITAFSARTADELKEALEQLVTVGLNGLILDLRFNPGGMLSSAVDVSDLFLDDGLIVSTDGRNIHKQSWHAREKGTFRGFPMVVLVNRHSASGSEIVAASLQDHERAIVIGERTFGKGSVQQVMNVEHGQSALKLTTGSYHRPSGKNIHRFKGAEESDDWGVMPNDGFTVRLSGREMRRLWLARSRRDDLAVHGKRRHEVAQSTEQDADQSEQDADARGDENISDGDGDKGGDEDQGGDEDTNGASNRFVDRQLETALEYLRTKQQVDR